MRSGRLRGNLRPVEGRGRRVVGYRYSDPEPVTGLPWFRAAEVVIHVRPATIGEIAGEALAGLSAAIGSLVPAVRAAAAAYDELGAAFDGIGRVLPFKARRGRWPGPVDPRLSGLEVEEFARRIAAIGLPVFTVPGLAEALLEARPRWWARGRIGAALEFLELVGGLVAAAAGAVWAWLEARLRRGR